MKQLFETFTPPFKYDPYGQMIFDSKNTLCLDVRGWGSFQKKVNGEELQDQWGEFVVEALNKASSNSD